MWLLPMYFMAVKLMPPATALPPSAATPVTVAPESPVCPHGYGRAMEPGAITSEWLSGVLGSDVELVGSTRIGDAAVDEIAEQVITRNGAHYLVSTVSLPFGDGFETMIFACNVKESDLATADANPYVLKVRDYVRTHLSCEAVVISAQIESDLVDHAYIDAHTEGFEQLYESVREYRPEHVAEITGLSVDLLYRVASLYGNAKAAFIGWTMGVNHSSKGTETVNAINNLALLTGNIGRAGASPFSITGARVNSSSFHGTSCASNSNMRKFGIDAPSCALIMVYRWPQKLCGATFTS